MLEKTCDLCKEFSGDPDTIFRRIYAGTPENRILLRSNNFAVLPSIGQLVEGYLLVLPIKHFKTLGDLPCSYFDEFVTLCDRVGDVLKDQYGSYIFFEHGTRSETVGGCGIYHAHMHAVPLLRTCGPLDSLKSKFAYKQINDLTELGTQSEGMSAYLLYQDSDSALYLFDTPNLPSQYMRRVLAAAIGASNWDWRIAGKEERLLTTLNRLSMHFDSSAEPIADETSR